MIWRCGHPSLVRTLLLGLSFFLYCGLGVTVYWRQHPSAKNAFDFHRTRQSLRYLGSENSTIGSQESHTVQIGTKLWQPDTGVLFYSRVLSLSSDKTLSGRTLPRIELKTRYWRLVSTNWNPSAAVDLAVLDERHTATHCNTLQHSATYCNTLQHAATHCNILQHTTTRCNTLQLDASLADRHRWLQGGKDA